MCVYTSEYSYRLQNIFEQNVWIDFVQIFAVDTAAYMNIGKTNRLAIFVSPNDIDTFNKEFSELTIKQIS